MKIEAEQGKRYLRGMPRPDEAWSCRLAALEGHWLIIECEKGHITYYPLRLMAMKHGGNLVLHDVVPRLRCRSCGTKPAKLRLSETAYTDNEGMAGAHVVGWSVDLLNPPAAL